MKSLVEHDPRLKGMYWVQDAGACSGVYILEQGRTMIDAGNMYGLADELEDLGPVDGLQRILLTHSHFDHIGGLAEIYQLCAPDLYVHPHARQYLNLHRRPFPEFFNALEKEGKLKLINEGDVIAGDPPLRVLHIPGHTAGDVGFFDESSGTLFCGDAVLPQNVPFGTLISKPDEMCGGRLQDKVSSLKRLLGLPVRHLFCGHGEPVFDRGSDQIKMSLVMVYRSLEEEHLERAWLLIAMDLADTGQLEDARRCAEKALKLNPEYAKARAFLQELESRRQ